jgi:predicted nucleic acid-binding protein
LVVLDSWALLAYLNGEDASSRVEEVWLADGVAISSINLGEALYILIRDRGEEIATSAIEETRKRSRVVGADWPMVRAAARIKVKGGLSYADAFCVATARSLNAPLWTGDPEIVESATSLECEVVDLRDPAG